MIKKHKITLLITSVLILLPLLFCRTLIPFALLAVHWFCVFFTLKDPGNQEQNTKVTRMVLWIIPVVSWFASLLIYSGTHGMVFHPIYLTQFLIGFVFIVVGNYLPKCKQNHTIGIKLSWTYRDEENWNKTHRFAGKVWVFGGLLLLFSIFLPTDVLSAIIIPLLLIIGFSPIVYSYLFYQKKKARGEEFHSSMEWPAGYKNSKFGKYSATFGIVLAVILIGVMFTGDIEYEFGEDAFVAKASYWNDLKLDYAEIDSIEYRDEEMSGHRASGYASARLLFGTFENKEFGFYTRYTYNNCDACIVLTVDEDYYVISGKDPESTKAIYEELVSFLPDIV